MPSTTEKFIMLKQFSVTCLEFLVSIGEVTSNQINESGWYVKNDSSNKLKGKNFCAAVSRDIEQIPFILIDFSQPIKSLAYSIAHESIHLAQTCRGDLSQEYGYSLWKGEEFIPIHAEHPDYFSKEHQPWEYEARELEDTVRKHLYSKFSFLK